MSKDMFEIDLDNINIEDIMREIRKNIKEKGIIDEKIELDQISTEEDMLPEYLEKVNNLYNVNYYKNITSHRKFIGKLIVFIKKVIRKSISWYIRPIVEQQNQFNEFLTKSLNCMNVKIDNIEGKNQDKFNNIEDKFNNIYEGTQHINLKLRRIEEKLKCRDISTEKTKYLAPEEEKLDFDYFLFEQKYRGSQENIKSKLKQYLKYFEKENNVLDIGCGRGEFLEILRENNIDAKGIEIDEDMLMICKEKNLNVENIDALTYLSNLEDNSLGGIILTQVIEHLEPNYLIRLVSLAYEKLKPEAYFIAETINPQSLIVFTEAYFMDLSHVRMIHPYTIKFLAESEGFKELSIKYLSKVGDDLRIPEISEFPAEFNQAIGKLNDIVYGYRDYAIIGRK